MLCDENDESIADGIYVKVAIKEEGGSFTPVVINDRGLKYNYTIRVNDGIPKAYFFLGDNLNHQDNRLFVPPSISDQVKFSFDHLSCIAVSSHYMLVKSVPEGKLINSDDCLDGVFKEIELIKLYEDTPCGYDPNPLLSSVLPDDSPLQKYVQTIRVSDLSTFDRKGAVEVVSPEHKFAMGSFYSSYVRPFLLKLSPNVPHLPSKVVSQEDKDLYYSNTLEYYCKKGELDLTSQILPCGVFVSSTGKDKFNLQQLAELVKRYHVGFDFEYQMRLLIPNSALKEYDLLGLLALVNEFKEVSVVDISWNYIGGGDNDMGKVFADLVAVVNVVTQYVIVLGNALSTVEYIEEIENAEDDVLKKLIWLRSDVVEKEEVWGSQHGIKEDKIKIIKESHKKHYGL